MTTSNARTFTAVLEPLRTRLRWVIARIPFDVTEAWPVRRGMRVRGEIDGFAFRTSAFVSSGGEGQFLLINKKTMAAIHAAVGTQVRISLEPDFEERAAEVPRELARALKGDSRLRPWFDALPFSARKEMGEWVSEPKSAAACAKRAERMAERLLLALEGEAELPPILHAAFLRQPAARAGWEAMTPARRRGHLLGIFYYESAEARERRATKAVDDALGLAGRTSGSGKRSPAKGAHPGPPS
jgi:uncharacterized protein YdeI (YjbR/CyaY-like superfamily)